MNIYGYLFGSFGAGALIASVIFYYKTIARERRLTKMCAGVLEAQKKGHLLRVLKDDEDSSEYDLEQVHKEE